LIGNNKQKETKLGMQQKTSNAQRQSQTPVLGGQCSLFSGLVRVIAGRKQVAEEMAGQEKNDTGNSA
jgi:hypothetical protein